MEIEQSQKLSYVFRFKVTRFQTKLIVHIVHR